MIHKILGQIVSNGHRHIAKHVARAVSNPQLHKHATKHVINSGYWFHKTKVYHHTVKFFNKLYSQGGNIKFK